MSTSPITVEKLEALYVDHMSVNEAVLMTIDGFGISTGSDGLYTCVATNNLTQAQRNVTISVQGEHVRHNTVPIFVLTLLTNILTFVYSL